MGTLLVLGTWWVIFLRNNVEEIYQHELEELMLQAQLVATNFQLNGQMPASRASRFMVIPSSREGAQELTISLGPRRPDLTLKPKPGVVEELADSYQMKLIQVFGEGALLLLLILVTMFMLYYIVLVEGRVLRSMENFLSTVTHELKTPIAGLKALLQTLSLRSLTAESSHRYIDMGLKESARLQHLVENVLAVNRLDRNGMQISRQAVNLRLLLEREIENKRYLFSETSDPKLQCGSDLVVQAGPEALRIIVENLLENAYKYTLVDPKITITAAKNNDEINLLFTDNGIGLKAEEIEHIFKRFYRATEKDVKAIKGSGLGLYIARTLSRSMGGELTASSDGHSKGSTFSIRLRSWE